MTKRCLFKIVFSTKLNSYRLTLTDIYLFVMLKRWYEKDVFPLFLYFLLLIREQYMKLPDGRDGIQFLVFKNHTRQNKRCSIMRNFTRVLWTIIKYFFWNRVSKGEYDNDSCTYDTANIAGNGTCIVSHAILFLCKI